MNIHEYENITANAKTLQPNQQIGGIPGERNFNY